MKKGIYNSKLNLEEAEMLQAEVCPNCWGTQEWEGKFFQYYKDREIDVLNHDQTAQKAFIQQFVEEHITGIRLKKQEEGLVCPACHALFKLPAEEKGNEEMENS